MPATKLVLFIGSISLLLYILRWYSVRKEEVQKADCSTYDYLQSNYPLDRETLAWMTWIHKKTVSFVWMQLACFISFMIDLDLGHEMYLLVTLGHVLKNFSKSYLQSPRGFWFCTKGKAIHCGSGYSLPSGHSMMSLLSNLYLTHKLKIKILMGILTIMEIYIAISVIYLGTHTIMDVIIGFLFAIAYFSFFLVFSHFFLPYITNTSSKKMMHEKIFFVLLLICGLSIFLETIEAKADEEKVHPIQLQNNYESYCSLAPGKAAEKMKNSSAYEKSALLLGIAFGIYLKLKLKIEGSQDSTSSNTIKKVIRTIIGWIIFSWTKDIFHYVLKLTIGIENTDPMIVRFGHYFIQPILLLVFLPIFFHSIKLANFRPKQQTPRKRKME